MAYLDKPRITLLVGGVGGAKLAHGMAQILPADQLTIIVNTGDDFWHYGLRICPDLDTITYTLAGIVDKANGWGLAGDSENTLNRLKQLGDEAWFTLRDLDLATHLLRTRLWHEDKTLTEITRQMSQSLGVQHPILPMTDAEAPTIVETEEYGTLGFQEYFVRYRWQPRAVKIYTQDIESAIISESVQNALRQADAIVIGPSNPWLSIQPILSVPGLRDMMVDEHATRIAVTPLIRGDAVKGPTAKIMRELGYNVSARAVRDFYGDVINGFVIDERDGNVDWTDTKTLNIDTLMDTEQKRIDVAKHVLEWIKDFN